MINDIETRLSLLEKKMEKTGAVDSGPLLGTLIAQYQSLFGLRAFWPCSSWDNNLALYDISGQDRTMTWSGAASGLSIVGLNDIPYIQTIGTTGYWSRANEVGLQITNQITLMAWIDPQTDVTQPIIYKPNSYTLYYEQGGNILGRIYNSSTIYDVRQSGVAPLFNFTFAAMTFLSSTSFQMYVNGVQTSYVGGVPASIDSNTNALYFGNLQAGTNVVQTMMAICNYPIPKRSLDRIYSIGRTLFAV